MTLLSIPAAAEILDDTPRHVGELIEAGELTGVDTAVHRSRPGTVRGADGKSYPTSKRRLKVTAESVRAFITRRAIGKTPKAARRERLRGVVKFL